MKITHVILHELIKEKHQDGELNPREKELDIRITENPDEVDPVEHLVDQILELYTRKLGKGIGFFEENTINYPFSKLLDDFLKFEETSEDKEEVSEQFVKFTSIAMENLLAKINDEEFATGGYILFTLYIDEDGTQKCCIAMLRNKQGSAIDNDLNVKESIHLDLDKLHICCQIDIDSWQDPDDEHTKYMTFIKGRASSTTPKYFLKFVGCAEFSDSKSETETLTQIIKDYCRDQRFNNEESINFKRKVYDYCKDKSDNHESVYVTDLSHYLNEEEPDKFLLFVNNGNYEVSNGFEIHPHSLKKLQRVTGGNKHIRLSFDANLYGNQVKLISDGRRIFAKGQTVVIENTPSNLVDAIKEVKNGLIMTPNDRFATSVALIRRFENYNFHSDHELDGDIVLNDGTIRDLIYLYDEGGIDQIKIGDEVIASHLERRLPSKDGERATVRLILNALGKIYRNFDLFLINSDHRIKKPELFYIIDEDIDSRDDKPKDLLAGYNDIISFIDMLAQLSDLPDRMQSGEDIFFSGATRREIFPVYISTDIRTLSDLAELRRNLLTELHHDEKRGIFKSTLLDLVSDEGDERSLFAVLIQRYEILKKKYLEAYHVYIQQFSADEIMQEVQERNIELASKLHNIIVELHKSLFALPIAFIFAATRIDSQAAYSLGNTMILICSWIAVLLFFLSLASHWKTLNFVCKEIEIQKGNASKYKGLEDKLIPPYNELIGRCSFQRGLMKWLGTALLFILITITGMYCYLGSINTKHEQYPIEKLNSNACICDPQSTHMIFIFKHDLLFKEVKHKEEPK